ncbi:MAG TPA: type II toxin-antitoxin system HipA family toxin [Gammaproteobacteria bacterium]|nr:type II toxin-antitoxin system HipA family toxin [Gammaproteobacteria bacterium]
MATDREAVVWTRSGTAPVRMGRFVVTDTECRYTYDSSYLDNGLPGLGILYDPTFIGENTITWKRSQYFDLLPQLQTLIPPTSEGNFQRQLILSWLQQQNKTPEQGFDSDWAILMAGGHGGIGHIDVFENDDQASEWYSDTRTQELFTINEDLGFSLKDFMTWFDNSAEALIEALGPTPSVGGAIPKLLLSIPDSGWDGRIALPTRCAVADRTDIVVKFEKPTYPGIVELEALTLQLHAEAGFEVPRYWTAEINAMPVIAIERYDRDPNGKPLFTESLYSVMATGDSRVTHHYSSNYDDIGRVIERSPIPIVSDPQEAKHHLLKRLIMSFATGNGDLHMENLSLIQRDGQTLFSPVYDPTPMRAYSRHDMLSVMPFGNYGELDNKDQPIGFEAALVHLAKNMGFSRNTLRLIVSEVLEHTASYPQQIRQLQTLPKENQENLIRITTLVRDILNGLM